MVVSTIVVVVTKYQVRDYGTNYLGTNLERYNNVK